MALLIPELWFSSANAAKYLNFLRCVLVLDLVLVCHSDLNERIKKELFLLHCVGNKSCVVHWNEFLIQCVRFWVEFSPFCSVTKTFAIGLQNDLIAKKYFTEKIRTPKNIYPQKVYKPFKEVKRRNLSSITTYSSVKACSSDSFSQKVYFLKMFFAKIFILLRVKSIHALKAVHLNTHNL